MLRPPRRRPTSWRRKTSPDEAAPPAESEPSESAFVFLVTDIEDSVTFWEVDRNDMGANVATHDEILSAHIAHHHEKDAGDRSNGYSRKEAAGLEPRCTSFTPRIVNPAPTS